MEWLSHKLVQKDTKSYKRHTMAGGKTTNAPAKPQQQQKKQQKQQKTQKSQKHHHSPAAARRTAKAAAYDSDGDSDDSDSAVPRGPVPLKSLEHGKVRDFVAEFEQEHTTKQQNNKHTSKRARAEMQQLEIDKQKKKFRQDRAEKVVWRKFDRENRVFEQYYKSQLKLSDTEWEAFVQALRAPLSVHVRVNGHYKSLSEIVTGTLELDFPLEGVLVKRSMSSDGDEEDAPVAFGPVDWARQSKSMWKLSIDSKSLRKADQLRDLSLYFQTQSQLGTLQRLDPATSIIPDLLRVEPGHRVLDLCGGGENRAPAIIERLHDAETPGVLVVNERDAALAARAAQALSRTLALSRETIVTAHKPLEFPSPVDSAAETEGSGGVFDRVICSAPCSADGLIRKIPEKWRTWTPESGLKSHPSQVAIAAKAMGLVRTGGALLYCTRSFNPIENEAVVADLLRTGDGAYELVDLSGDCPDLERHAGLTTWDVYDEEMNAVGLWETATPAQRKLLRASMWPPTEDEATSSLHLDRCVRLLPHQNDTNGVFLALITKLREPETIVAGPASVATTLHHVAKQDKKKQVKATRKVLGSLSPLDASEVAQLVSVYGMPRNALVPGQVMERSGFAKDSAIHIVTQAASAMMTTLFPGRLGVHRAGVEAFKKVGASFELTDDGARALLPVLRRRVLPLSMDEFVLFLTKKEMWLKNASAAAREVLDETKQGSLVVVLDDMEPMQTADQDLVVVAVKRNSSYSLVSTPAAIARVKSLMKELEANGDDEDGYDSMDMEDDE